MAEGVVRAVRTVEVVVGLAGGLLSELVAVGRVVDEVVAVVVGRGVPVDSLGATDLVGGLVGGCAVRGFTAEASSAADARAVDLSILMVTLEQTTSCRRGEWSGIRKYYGRYTSKTD